VHTSTVTVAVLPEPTEDEVRIDPRDLEERFVRGGGPGGQHRNKTSTCVVLLHVPTQTRVRIDGGRKREANRKEALAVLRARLAAAQRERDEARRERHRRDQVGSGQRGDKVRTIQVQHDTVVDHRTGRRTRFRKYAKGRFEDLR